MGKSRGRGKSRNMYRGPKDMDTGVGIDCGTSVVWGQWRVCGMGRREQWGENVDNCNLTIIKKRHHHILPPPKNKTD